MKEKSVGPKLLFGAFAVIILFSWVFWFFFKGLVDTENYENRSKAVRPELTFDNFEQFPKEYNEYINDNIPFRNSLVTIHSAVDFYFFQISSDSRVIIGSDNWLFYSDANDGDPLGCYQGNNLMTEEELKAVADNCILQRDYLSSIGKEFVIVIAPNKERVYQEHMPQSIGPPAPTYKTLQIVEYLQTHTDLRVIYLYDELMSAKNRIQENSYFKTDTHWNEIGGYIGSQILLKELGVEIPAIDSEQIQITAYQTAGDMAGFLGLTNLLKLSDRGYTIQGYNTHEYENLGGDEGHVILCTAKDANPKKLFVIRDSFARSMIPYLASQFNETCFRHRATYDAEELKNYDPDIVVYETVERYIDGLRSFSIQ